MIAEGRSFSGHERNCAFLNLGNEAAQSGAQFATISALSGLDFDDDGRAVSVVDWDRDGDLDLWIRNRNAPQLRLMRNEIGAAAGSFLRLRLIGDGTTTNRDAIGARVEVFVEGQGENERLVRTVRAGDGFLSQSSRWLHFGLGPNPGMIERVEIHWPTSTQQGQVQHLTGLSANEWYTVAQGAEAAESYEPPVLEGEALRPLPIELPPEESAIRVSATSLIPFFWHPYWDAEGQPAGPPLPNNRWTLLNLWATWCAPCRVEMKAFAQRAADFEAAGIDLIALSVEAPDGVPADSELPAAVSAMVEETGFSFPVGFAGRELIDDLQQVNRTMTGIHRDLPVPTSFLVNPRQQVVAIYKGLAPVDQILDDAVKVDRSFAERIERMFPLGGSLIPSEAVRQGEIEREATYQFEVGRRLIGSSREVSAAHLAESLRHRPEHIPSRLLFGTALTDLNHLGPAEAQLRWVDEHPGASAEQRGAAAYHLSTIALKTGAMDEALDLLKRSVAYDDDFPSALNNLAYLLATFDDESKRDVDRAIELAERAVELTNEKNPKYLDTLATAYHASGRYLDALAAIDKALPLAEEVQNEELIGKLNDRKAAIAKTHLDPAGD